MKYQEVHGEYVNYLARYVEIRQELDCLNKGTVVVKKISGKEYHYLQYRDKGKTKSIYLKNGQVETVKRDVARVRVLKSELDDLCRQLSRLEKGAHILDSNLVNRFRYLRQGAEMDAMPLSRRTKALSFIQAMTALEGLPSPSETEENLRGWAAGNKRFSDFYLKALQQYHVLEEYA